MEQIQILQNGTIIRSSHGNAMSISHHATGMVCCPTLNSMTTPDKDGVHVQMCKIQFAMSNFISRT